VRRFKRKGLPQLLDDPRTRQVPGDVEVQNAPTIMADDKEAVEHPEGERRNGKEIHGRDGFPVVTKKGKPALARLSFRGARFIQREMVLSETSKPSMSNSPWTRGAPPGWILGDHAEDEIPNLLGGRSSARLLRDPGNQPPIQKETGSMPTNDRFWSDDEERLLPTGPDSPSNYAEDPVERAQARSRTAALQNGKLLA
jgi:hypothetical protein